MQTMPPPPLETAEPRCGDRAAHLETGLLGAGGLVLVDAAGLAALAALATLAAGLASLDCIEGRRRDNEARRARRVEAARSAVGRAEDGHGHRLTSRHAVFV